MESYLRAAMERARKVQEVMLQASRSFPLGVVDAVHDNLRNLGLDHLDVVNLRVGGISEPRQESIEEPLAVLIKLKREGLIRHIGLSNISPSS